MKTGKSVATSIFDGIESLVSAMLEKSMLEVVGGFVNDSLSGLEDNQNSIWFMIRDSDTDYSTRFYVEELGAIFNMNIKDIEKVMPWLVIK